MPDLHVSVREKIAVGDGTKIVCGNSDYNVIFDFDAEWQEYAVKTMRVRLTQSEYMDVVFTGTECALPKIKNRMYISIGVFAGDLHTTTPASFDCVRSILCEDGAEVEPDPDVYAQLLQLIEDGAVKGEKGDPGKDGTDGYTPIKGVDYFDGLPGESGKDGEDGYTPVKGVDYFDGQPGKDGIDGKNGVDGKDGYTPVKGIDYFDGEKGEPGYTPQKGIDYFDGQPGADGYTPIKGVDYFDGLPGKDGLDGKDGVDGKDGYTPQKGIDYFDGQPGADGKEGSPGKDGKTPVKGADYWTPADQEAIVQDVIAALGTPIFGTVDADNNITLTGKLADGLYILKYEDAEGNTTVVGTLDTSPGYTNMLLRAVDADGNPYNGGQGWKTNTRLNSSGVESTSSAEGVECTGFIPFKRGDIIRFENIVMNKSVNGGQSYFVQYDSNKTMLKQWVVSGFNGAINKGWVLVDDNYNILQIDTGMFYDENSGDSFPIYTNAAFFRISANEINADSIITINQEIN